MGRCFLLVAATLPLLACGSSSDAPTTGDDSGVTADTIAADVLDAFDSGSDTGGTDTIADSPGDAAVLDCKWVNDPANCWRTFVKGVDACLHNPIGSTVRGALATDRKTCTYTDGRTIEFALPEAMDAPDRANRDLKATLGGVACVRYTENVAVDGFVVTGPGGTLSYTAVGNDVTVECPDGSRYEGDAANIAKLCGGGILSGGVPGRTVLSSGADIRLQLAGMKDVVYACTLP